MTAPWTAFAIVLALLSFGCGPAPDDASEPAAKAPKVSKELGVDATPSTPSPTPPAEPEPTTTTDDSAGDDAATPHKYVGATKCGSCHKKEPIGNQYGVWQKSKHATALETLASEKARKWADEAGVADPQTDDRCVKCHVTAHDAPPELLGLKFKREESVTCEACHGAGRDYREEDHDRSGAGGLEGSGAPERGGLHHLPQRREPGLEARSLHAG
ncbi:MAG: cytochrome c family protein [Deltaproteobacteria bacterium]|nr:cytochrome c family protein [Deltaproteobacteria bacterium]